MIIWPSGENTVSTASALTVLISDNPYIFLRTLPDDRMIDLTKEHVYKKVCLICFIDIWDGYSMSRLVSGIDSGVVICGRSAK